MQLLDCFGIGIVMQDKDTDTDEVMIHCPALFPTADGEAKGSVNKMESQIKTPTGDTIASSGLSSNGIMMKWLPFNTNRITSPDVRKGSTVAVYKFKGSSKYRWMYFGMDGTLRLETVIMAYSASPNVNEDSPLTPDNYYIFTISSHQGKIALQTGQGNGEPTRFDITLNTKEGRFNLLDGEENLFALNSMQHAWRLSNQEKTIFGIDKKKMFLSAEDEILMKGTEHIGIKTKKLDIVADQQMNIQVGEVSTWKSPKIIIQGDISHTGNTEQQGNYAQQGKMTTSGGIVSQADVSAGGISVMKHKHGGVQGGPGMTEGPQ